MNQPEGLEPVNLMMLIRGMKLKPKGTLKRHLPITHREVLIIN
jgi:hypothetical protein